MGYDEKAMLKLFNDIQQENDKRKDVVKEKPVVKKNVLPWEELLEEELELFNDVVDDIYKSELYREKNVRSLREIGLEVWNGWQRGRFK